MFQESDQFVRRLLHPGDYPRTPQEGMVLLDGFVRIDPNRITQDNFFEILGTLEKGWAHAVCHPSVLAGQLLRGTSQKLSELITATPHFSGPEVFQSITRMILCSRTELGTQHLFQPLAATCFQAHFMKERENLSALLSFFVDLRSEYTHFHVSCYAEDFAERAHDEWLKMALARDPSETTRFIESYLHACDGSNPPLSITDGLPPQLRSTPEARDALERKFRSAARENSRPFARGSYSNASKLFELAKVGPLLFDDEPLRTLALWKTPIETVADLVPEFFSQDHFYTIINRLAFPKKSLRNWESNLETAKTLIAKVPTLLCEETVQLLCQRALRIMTKWDSSLYRTTIPELCQAAIARPELLTEDLRKLIHSKLEKPNELSFLFWGSEFVAALLETYPALITQEMRNTAKGFAEKRYKVAEVVLRNHDDPYGELSVPGIPSS
ncbi:MAG: hypothetical protein KDD64_05015 [Bdellovibrionales bacterium]|nr:hypothetical protein [Bdellovibrionales bacterium]